VVADSGIVIESKNAVKQERLNADIKKCENVKKFLSNEIGAADQEMFPVPIMMFNEFYARITKLISSLTFSKIRLLHALKGEADEILAQLAVDPSSLLLGNDSDFFFVDNINYVPFNEFRITEARVYSRASVATAVGISPDRMTALALFLGNDYTKTSKKRRPHLDELVKEFKKRPSDFQNGIEEYSVEFYANKPQGNCIDSVCALLQQQEKVGAYRPVDETEETILLPRPTRSRPSDKFSSILSRVTSEAIVVSLQVYDKLDGKCSEKNLGQAIDEAVGSFQLKFWDMNSPIKLSALCMTKESSSHLLSQLPEGYSNIYLLAYSYQVICLWFLNRMRFHSGMSILPSHYFCLATFFQGVHLRVRKEKDMKSTEMKPITTEPCIGSTSSESLPVDLCKDEILLNIASNRIVIVHGETGSGKSSRIPVFLMEGSSRNKIMVSQPRRIAARSLFNRVRDVVGPALQDQIGLRLGGGVREELNNTTRLWYVTTGYLTRKLAGDPGYFNSFSHLIIDEIHERSVDMDIVCFLIKKLLEENSTIKIVLMSATIQAALFKDYFKVPNDPLFVGSKRFRLTELYLDSEEMKQSVPSHCHQALKLNLCALNEVTLNGRISMSMNMPKTYLTNLYKVAVGLTQNLAKTFPESAILIFVSGITDIFALFDHFDRESKNLECVAIHSSIPHEEQMEAWTPAKPNHVKVIIATNSAESSVTLPQVDHVICLGMKRVVEYDLETQASNLANQWVSQASGIQRAGRTARTRPGTVYRLYTKDLWALLPAFDVAEIHMAPMDSVVMLLKSMFKGPVVPMLLELLDPPKSSTGHQAILNLHALGILDGPDDKTCVLTKLGEFSASLSVDIKLCLTIARGVIFGCLPEAIALSAIGSVEQSPFRVASSLVLKDPAEYHRVMLTSFSSKAYFDGGLYSEPLALLRLLAVYTKTPNNLQRSFCMSYGIAYTRMQRMAMAHRHLIESVCNTRKYKKVDVALPAAETLLMEPELVNRLKFILLMSTPGHLLQYSNSNDVCNRVARIGAEKEGYVGFKWYANIREPEASYTVINVPSYVNDAEIALLFPHGTEWFIPTSTLSNRWVFNFDIFEEGFFLEFPETSKDLISALELFNFRDLLITPSELEDSSQMHSESQIDDPSQITLSSFLKQPSKKKNSKKNSFWAIRLKWRIHRKKPSEEVSSDSNNFSYDGNFSYDDLDHDFMRREPIEPPVLGDFLDLLVIPACQWFMDNLMQCFENKLKIIVQTEHYVVLQFPEPDMRHEYIFPGGEVTINLSEKDGERGLLELYATSNMERTREWVSTLFGEDVKLELESSHRFPTSLKPVFVRNHKGGETVPCIPFGFRALVAHASGNRPRTEVKYIQQEHKNKQGYTVKENVASFSIPGNLCSRFGPCFKNVPLSLKDSNIGERNVFCRQRSVRNVFLSGHSIEGTVVPMERVNVYGVAGTITLLAANDKKVIHSAAANYVTLFPPGEKWIDSALACLNSTTRKHLDAETQSLCNQTRLKIWELLNSKDADFSKLDEDLIEVFDKVFGEFQFCAEPLNRYIDQPPQADQVILISKRPEDQSLEEVTNKPKSSLSLTPLAVSRRRKKT